jgi:hypothetical protein
VTGFASEGPPKRRGGGGPSGRGVSVAGMSPLRPSLLIALLAATATAGVAAVASSAGTNPPAAKITPVRVDGVHLGDTHADLRARGKVGIIRPGCELGGPQTRSARLRAPLRGMVNYTLNSPRRVDSITIRGGARARGVGIGAKIPAIKAKFPNATIDHSTDQVFQLTLVKTPMRPSGGQITFGVSTQTKRTTIIGVPFIAFCE